MFAAPSGWAGLDGRAWGAARDMTPDWSLRGRKALPGCVKDKRGVRLNMANNPKKVKDPTEVALSAIQEALNISDVSATDNNRGSVHNDVAAADPFATSSTASPHTTPGLATTGRSSK